MKRIILFLISVFVCGTSHSQIFDQPYDKITDSLLYIFSEQIRYDLSLQGVNLRKTNIWNDSIPIIGDILLVQAIQGDAIIQAKIFNKPVYIYDRGVTDKFRKKKFRPLNIARFNSYREYVNTYFEYPYDLFEYIEYKFINFREKDAVYGRFKFRVTINEIWIVHNEWEIIPNLDVIEQKWRTNF